MVSSQYNPKAPSPANSKNNCTGWLYNTLLRLNKAKEKSISFYDQEVDYLPVPRASRPP